MCSKAKKRGKVIFVAGIPGSGKSTITSYISRKYRQVHILRYGELLYEFKKSSYPDLSYERFREIAPTIVTQADIEKADSFIVSKSLELSKTGQSVVIESHAVTSESYGLKVSPYSIEHLRKVELDAVMFVFTDPHLIVERLSSYTEGRRKMGESIIHIASSLQSALTLIYSIQTGKRLFVIENNSTISDLQAKVDELLLILEEEHGVRENCTRTSS